MTNVGIIARSSHHVSGALVAVDDGLRMARRTVAEARVGTSAIAGVVAEPEPEPEPEARVTVN
jgi:hypothetical protein